jgi:hypothetical protein
MRPISWLGLSVLLPLAAASPARAQAVLETPAPSPKARVDQRVGLTDFQLEYSSPGVKNRKIWGGLVPEGKVWRTGANAATKLTVSRDFTFGDKAIKAGAYSLWTIPGKTTWTVILSSAATVFGTEYDEKTDVARITVKPVALPAARERMTFLFSDTTDDGTNLDLEWEKLRVRIPIKVDTRKQMQAAVEQVTSEAWRPHYAAARWLLDSNGDVDQALGFVEKSIAIRPTWNNHWVKAQLLGKKGKKAEAVAAAQQAQQLGKGDEGFENFAKENVAKAIDGWK